ncbi:MAG TPA: translesion DNA synthesis-associated protein ImuA [Burkholderiales bacterium]|nr:translesion DNA synthesis-associated protein ImuA [Burkholderiales bacterium]
MALPLSLLQNAGLRRATELAQVHTASISSGYSSLDAQLPGGGWPSGGLTEILFAHQGIGELRLLGPALASLSRRKRRLAWIAPPYLPYGPALSAAGIDPAMLLIVRCTTSTEILWAAEQCLKSAACGAILLWPQQLRYTELRRLQLAAADTTALTFLFRSTRMMQEASPAALRLSLGAASGGLFLRILKRRGMALPQPLFISPAPPHAVDRPLLSPFRSLDAVLQL